MATPLDVFSVDKLIEYKRFPQVMVRELFHVEPDPWQVDVLAEFPHCPRQAMGACKGPGKTAAMAWLAWNFLLTRVNPKIGAVAITGGNLDDNLWAEMALWRQRCPVLEQQFEWGTRSIHLRSRPDTWFMSHKSWNRTANTEELGQTLAGMWAEHVLFLLDQAGGIPVPIMRNAEAALQRTGTEGHIVIAGNCNSIEGCLYDALVTNKGLWRTYHITADPDDPKRTHRIDIGYCRDMIKRFGRDDPWVMINILAKFPSQGINQLISLELVEACIGRHLHQRAYDWAPIVLGGDVAGQGDDRTVLVKRQGLVYSPPDILRKMDELFIAGRWMEVATSAGAHSIQIDNTGGYGAAVVSIMRNEGYHVLPIQFGGEASKKEQFFNKRAEMWWNLKENLELGASLPSNVPDMTAELVAPTFSYKGDRILVEPKDLVKARLGRSPDIADAMACTHAYPVAPPPDFRRSLFQFDIDGVIGRTKSDYNPLDRL